MRKNKCIRSKNSAEKIILPLKGRKTYLHVAQKMSHLLVFLVAVPILNLLSHSFPGKFPLLWPWQVLSRRNVLTRNDAQQSLEKAERERVLKQSAGARVFTSTHFRVHLKTVIHLGQLLLMNRTRSTRVLCFFLKLWPSSSNYVVLKILANIVVTPCRASTVRV